MDYAYYATPLENYNSEGDVNHRFEDDPSLGSGPAQVHSDDFYDEIEDSAYMRKSSMPSFLIWYSFVFSLS